MSRQGRGSGKKLVGEAIELPRGSGLELMKKMGSN